MLSSIRLPSLVPALLCALAASPLPSAQQAEPARAKEAGLVPKARELELPVTGLTNENSATLRSDLLALELTVHRCKACDREQTNPGTCPKCQGELETETRALFTSVEASALSNLVALSPDPMASVRISQIESTLTRRSVRIDDERFTLGGRLQLLVSSPPTEATAVERALKEAQLFAEIKVEPAPVTSQLVLTVRADAKPPSRAKVVAALQGAKARLVDVVWPPILARS